MTRHKGLYRHWRPHLTLHSACLLFQCLLVATRWTLQTFACASFLWRGTEKKDKTKHLKKFTKLRQSLTALPDHIDWLVIATSVVGGSKGFLPIMSLIVCKKYRSREPQRWRCSKKTVASFLEVGHSISNKYKTQPAFFHCAAKAWHLNQAICTHSYVHACVCACVSVCVSDTSNVQKVFLIRPHPAAGLGPGHLGNWEPLPRLGP